MVTGSSYENKRVIHNSSAVNLVFLFLPVFHFTKDEVTFPRSAVQMLAMGLSLKCIRKIGIDMEGAILNCVKHILPETKNIYCV